MINDRQFFLTKQDIHVYDDWKRIKLQNGFTLYCHGDLNIVYQSQRIFLLGYCWQVDPCKPSPTEQLTALEQLQTVGNEEIYSIEQSWCGRYLLIIDDWIYLDALGSLGLFYSQSTLSSSLNVLCSVEQREMVKPEIKHGQSPDFFPGMRTSYADVYRLLPSQIYNFVEQRWIFRPLLPNADQKFENEADCIATFSESFANGLKQMAKTLADRKICLALTGGYDSRVTMAALEHAGIDYQAFTLWHNNLKSPDAVLPRILAKQRRKNYRFIDRNKNQYSPTRYNDYLTHTAGMAVDEDWNFYAYGQYLALTQESKPIIVLRSGGWEIVREYYRWSKGDINRIYPGIQTNQKFRESVDEWNQAIGQDQLNKNLTYITRAYWDLRCGCWLSSVEQSFDLMDGIVSIQPFNCRLFIATLFAVGEQNRKSQKVQRDIVEYLCPTLAKVPYENQPLSNRQIIIRAKYYLFKKLNNLRKRQ